MSEPGGGWDWRAPVSGGPSISDLSAPPAPPPSSVPTPPPVAAAAPPAPEVAPDDRAAELAQIWRDAREPGPTPKGPRARGPRISARGLIWAGGLLGVLMTIGILGLVGTRVLQSLDDRSAAVPTGGAAGAAVECELARSTLASALEAYRIQTGQPAADQQALIDAGLLSEPVEQYVYDPAAPEPVRAVGDCAG